MHGLWDIVTVTKQCRNPELFPTNHAICQKYSGRKRGGWEPGVIMAGSGREAGRDGAGCGIPHPLSKRSNDPILKILKIFAKYFVIPLTEIFNESFQSKIFPKAWKKYKVLGNPKSVPCTLVEDLRPITLTSVVAKAQESHCSMDI